jgi:hypothetical protein
MGRKRGILHEPQGLASADNDQEEHGQRETCQFGVQMASARQRHQTL